MSSNRHGAALMAYSLSPERNSVRVMVTSARSIGSLPAALSMVSDTSARPSCGREEVPAKMTSSIFAERSERGPCAPSTQVTASTTLDLPLPLGPTTTVTPGSNSSTVGSAKDLKPFMLSDFRNIGATLPEAYRAVRGSHLAVLAEEGRAPARLHPHNGVATAAAGLALPVVDLVRALEVAELAEEVAVLLVGQGGAPVLDGVGQRLDNGPVEPAHLGGRQRVGRPVVAQAGLVEHLVGVEVPDARREVLVHQERLDPPVVLVQEGAEAVPAHQVLNGVEAQVGELGDGLADGGAVTARRARDRAQRGHVGLEGRRGDEHLAEGAGVHVAQLTALGEGDGDVGVLGLGVLGGLDPQQLPAHAEMHDQG